MLVTSVVRRVTGPRWRTCRYWKRNNPECRPEHRLAQIGGQTRARPRAVDTRANAADHRQHRHHGHQRTDLRDVRHVAHGDALVDDGRGEIRNQNFKHDAQRRIHRRKQRVFLYCLISFAMRAPVICFFSPVFFSSAIRILLFCSFCFYLVFFYAVILPELRGRRDFKHAPEEVNKRRRILSEHGEPSSIFCS